MYRPATAASPSAKTNLGSLKRKPRVDAAHRHALPSPPAALAANVLHAEEARAVGVGASHPLAARRDGGASDVAHPRQRNASDVRVAQRLARRDAERLVGALGGEGVVVLVVLALAVALAVALALALALAALSVLELSLLSPSLLLLLSLFVLALPILAQRSQRPHVDVALVLHEEEAPSSRAQRRVEGRVHDGSVRKGRASPRPLLAEPRGAVPAQLGVVAGGNKDLVGG